MKRALVSVSDKTGLVEFCKELVSLGYELISTGGTKKTLEENGLKVIGISEVTGFPEILDGRVKTLHPNVHGALLAKRDLKEHMDTLKEHHIDLIDMVVVNLYPFKKTIEREDCTLDLAIENIDIGGPSMLRSAAKNFASVTVLCDSNDYSRVLEEIKENGNTTYETRFFLAGKVFRHTASYDGMIASYMMKKTNVQTPEKLTLSFDLKQTLRYGENPHQKAAFYQGEETSYSMAYATQLWGKELSYNNIQDANAALNIVHEFSSPCVVGLKHMNPCGVGLASTIDEAYDKAYMSDPVSIFGGIIAMNRPVTATMAKKMGEIFLEIILAPSYEEEALKILKKKKNIRLMTFDMDSLYKADQMYTFVNGGLLVQERDNINVIRDQIQVVTKLAPTKEELEQMIFGFAVCKYVKSNAITVVKDYMTVGVGAGQMNRVGSAHIALEQAKNNGHTENLILASDAFFPFDDVVKMAKDYHVTCIIQPGGSIRDEDSIRACDEAGIKMVFTGIRHFRH